MRYNARIRRSAAKIYAQLHEVTADDLLRGYSPRAWSDECVRVVKLYDHECLCADWWTDVAPRTSAREACSWLSSSYCEWDHSLWGSAQQERMSDLTLASLLAGGDGAEERLLDVLDVIEAVDDEAA